MFVIHYRVKNYNPHRSYFRNADRHAASAIFGSIEEARAGLTVIENDSNTDCIKGVFDIAGNRIAL